MALCTHHEGNPNSAYMWRTVLLLDFGVSNALSLIALAFLSSGSSWLMTSQTRVQQRGHPFSPSTDGRLFGGSDPSAAIDFVCSGYRMTWLSFVRVPFLWF